jgi:hypothetical protein
MRRLEATFSLITTCRKQSPPILACWEEDDVACRPTRRTTDLSPAPGVTGPETMTAMALVALEGTDQLLVMA